MKVTVLLPKLNGENQLRTVTLTTTSDNAGAPLKLSRGIPIGAAFYPPSIEDCRALIAHFEAALELMQLPEPGEKTTTPDRNTGIAR
jgi:hypothetical protein